MKSALPPLESPVARGIPIAWAVIAGLLVLQVFLSAPAALTGIQSEWQVAQAYPSFREWLTPSEFGLLVLSLRLSVMAVCLTVSALLIGRRPAPLIAWLAAFTLLGLPGLFNSGEGMESAVGLLAFLNLLQRLVSAASWPALLLLFLLFPDGRFYPAWLRIPALFLLAVLAVLFVLFTLPLELAWEWAWAVLLLLLLVLLLAALVGQVLRFRAAPPASRPVLLPLLASLAFFLLSFFLTILGGPFSLAAGMLAVLTVPLALAWDVLRWDMWQARPGPADQWIFLASAAALVILVPISLSILNRQLQAQEVELARQAEQALDAARPRPVIVDADMAMDDILALMVLLNHPAVDLRAITVTGTGEAHCAPGVRHALGLLEQAQGYASVPVACGRETPLAGTQEFPAEWRAQVDRLYGLALPPTDRQPSPLTAVELILETVSASPEKVTLIALGPLTNLAEAFQVDPTLAQRLEMVYIMGGAVDVPGNVGPSSPQIDNPYAEWNIFADPHAASLVLQSGVPTTWIGLDATRYTEANQAFFESLRARQDTLEARFAYNLMYINQGMLFSGGYQFWDVLTSLVALDENLARFEQVSLSVVETPGPELGRTIRDPQGAPARFATWADGPGFERAFLFMLNRP